MAIILHATVNATLIRILEIGKICLAKMISLKMAAEKVQHHIYQETNVLASDRFLVEANWAKVDELVNFRAIGDVGEEAQETFLQRLSKCPECHTLVVNEPSKDEIKELVEESRSRLMFLERVSYLNQFQCGKIPQRMTHELNETSEILSEQPGVYLNIEDRMAEIQKSNNTFLQSKGIRKRKKTDVTVEKHAKTTATLQAAKSVAVLKEDFKSLQIKDPNRLGPTRSLFRAASAKAREEMQDPKSRLHLAISEAEAAMAHPTWRQQNSRQRLERVVHSTAFEAIFIFVILVNMAPMAWELNDNTREHCRDPTLQSVNYIFLSVYFIEYILRIVVDGRQYLPKSLWGWIDTFILVIGVVTIVTNVMTSNRPVKGTPECQGEMAAAFVAGSQQGRALRFIKMLRVVRIVRLLRLFRFLMPPESKFMRYLENSVIHDIFEECTALTCAQSDIKVHLEKIAISAFKPLAESCEARTNINVFLGQKKSLSFMRKHPGVEVAVRTKQALTTVFNVALNRLAELHAMGFLEEHENNRIHDYVIRKRSSVRNLPPGFYEPTAVKSLNLLPWFHEAEDAVQNFFIQKAQIVEFPAGSVVQNVGGSYDGIYVVGMGTLLVKGEAGLRRYDMTVSEKLDEHKTIVNIASMEKIVRSYLTVLQGPQLLIDLEEHDNSLRKKIQSLEMHFVTRGFVLNHINIVRPEIPIRDAICITPVLTYFLSRPKIEEMLTLFDNSFENVEMRIWKELFLLYYTRINSNVITDEQLEMMNRGFVVIVDDHFLESGGGIAAGVGGSVRVLPNDLVNVASMFVLQGSFNVPCTDQSFRGPCNVPENMAVEYVVFKNVSWQGNDSLDPRVLVIPKSSSYGVVEVKTIAKTLLMEEAREAMRRGEEQRRRVGEEHKLRERDERGARKEELRKWASRESRKGLNKSQPLNLSTWTSSTFMTEELVEEEEEDFGENFEGIEASDLPDDVIADLRRLPEAELWRQTAIRANSEKDSLIIKLVKIRIKQIQDVLLRESGQYLSDVDILLDRQDLVFED